MDGNLRIELNPANWGPTGWYAAALTAWLVWDNYGRDLLNECSCHLDPNIKNCNEKDTGSGLLPIMNPKFNMREIAKQSTLLEYHLMQRRMRCVDCIRKHFLTMEGLAEEAITLDKTGEYSHLLQELPEFYRRMQKQLKINRTRKPGFHGNEHEIAQQVRQRRKKLMQHCCHSFK